MLYRRDAPKTTTPRCSPITHTTRFNNWHRRLTGWDFALGILSFALICSFGAVADVGIATLLFAQQHSVWWVAGIAGALTSC
jgi:dolichol-phosphate mannosyltransferase